MGELSDHPRHYNRTRGSPAERKYTMLEFLIVVGIVVGALAALRAPGDMEQKHGGSVATPAARAGLMGGTCAVMGGVGVLLAIVLLAALWAAAAVVI